MKRFLTLFAATLTGLVVMVILGSILPAQEARLPAGFWKSVAFIALPVLVFDLCVAIPHVKSRFERGSIQ